MIQSIVMEGQIGEQADCFGLAPDRRESKLDRFLGVSRSRSSSLSFSSDRSDSTEAMDEFEEDDVWEAERGDSDRKATTISYKTAITRTIIPDRNGSLLGFNDFNAISSPPEQAPGSLKAVVRAISNTPKGVMCFPASFIHSYVDTRAKIPTAQRPYKDLSRYVPAGSRMIPKGRLSETTTDGVMHHSAPVNIPDWNKILSPGKLSKIVIDDGNDAYEEAKERLPPHELLARDYAKSQISCFSVFEGAGRTLKGRDMRQVRDAVYRQTGFSG